MKTTILIKENRTQLVLHPESEHDKSVVKILTKLPNTHQAHLFDRQGGYTAFGAYPEDKDLMIVFDTEAK